MGRVCCYFVKLPLQAKPNWEAEYGACPLADNKVDIICSDPADDQTIVLNRANLHCVDTPVWQNYNVYMYCIYLYILYIPVKISTCTLYCVIYAYRPWKYDAD